MLVAGRAHKAFTIIFGEAKEGAMEAHNFSLQASITTIHMQNEKKQDATSVASATRTLAKSVFSIGTSILKVTEDDMDESEEEDDSKDGRPQNKKPRIAMEGMRMLKGEKVMPCSSRQASKSNQAMKNLKSVSLRIQMMK
jgi:hypothetical protein